MKADFEQGCIEMPETAATVADAEPLPLLQGHIALADYEEWFTEPTWTLDQAAALIVGLNPAITLNPETAKKYDDFDPADPVVHRLWRYSEEIWGSWYEVQHEYREWFFNCYCASELENIVENDTPAVKPMNIIQWCVDKNIPMHFRLTEYLEGKGYDFRFSKNSEILSQMQIYGRKEIWWMPVAARLVLGLHPEAAQNHLSNRKNFYRHLDPNYTQTQRDEIYHVKEIALESWKTKTLEFFEIHGNDPEDNYYDDKNGECGVFVEAKKFVTWAISKGFNPPVQLLEFMGMTPAAQTEALQDTAPTKQEDRKEAPPFWVDFLDVSGEVILNGVFTIATPETNGQNYKIIKYLIANPNKFVTADELKTHALGGKNLDKRLTEFVAQINMNKDLGRLFFDTGQDSIRLNNPVTPERMTEQNIRRVRIKPA